FRKILTQLSCRVVAVQRSRSVISGGGNATAETTACTLAGHLFSGVQALCAIRLISGKIFVIAFWALCTGALLTGNTSILAESFLMPKKLQQNGFVTLSAPQSIAAFL